MPEIRAWIEASRDLKQGTHFKEGRFFAGDEDYLIEVQREVELRRPDVFTAGERDLNRPEKSGSFHFELGAIPYVGNLRSARIFLFMINPGVNEYDYTDLRNPEVQNLFERDRHQELDYCFAFKESEIPEQAWTRYFTKMFGGVIGRYPKNKRECCLNALEKSVAILELVPYFSRRAIFIDNFGITDRKRTANGPLEEGLPSSRMALKAAHQIASNKDNLIITRWRNTARRYRLVGERDNWVNSTCMSGLTEIAKQRIRTKLEQIYPGCL